MSRTADAQIERVERLARETGVDEDVVFNAYFACMACDETLEDFEKHVRRCVELAEKTKYTADYLVQTYAENMVDGNDFEHFEGVTKEEDW